MAQRRFGPTLGAGVAIIEREAEKVIEPAPLGVTLYVTPLEKGSTEDLISTYSKRDMISKVGGLIDGYDGPDCGQDFWDAGNGSGELHFLRVVSAANAPRAASLDVYSREMDVGSLSGTYTNRKVMRVTAKNGGRWASRKRTFWKEVALIGDIGATTLTTGETMLLDEWEEGVVKLSGVPAKEYQIVSNTTAGVITVASDENMAADLAAGGDPTNKGYELRLRTRVGPEGDDRVLSVEFDAGEQNPNTEFSMNIFVNEEMVRRYPDLNMDPAHIRYFANLINDDQSNYECEVTDLLSPSNPAPADRRPANESGVVSDITATVLTRQLVQIRVTVGDCNPSVSVLASTDLNLFRDTYEFECTAAPGTADLTMKSLRVAGGDSVHATVQANNTQGTNFDFDAPLCPLVPDIRITVGATVFEVGDKFQVDFFPFEPDALIGGLLIPDFDNSPDTRFRITDNDHESITVTGDLITDGGGAVDDRWMVIYPQELGGPDVDGSTPANGYDGLGGLTDTDYTNVHLSTINSRARDLLNQNKGLVKVATPDRTSTSVVQAGLAFAENLNWQYRVEIPDSVTDEAAALAHINTTIGRNDFGVTSFPSYGDVNDVEKPGQLKRIPLTGMIHGRESLIAKNYNGYHKAATGIDVTLPRVVKLPFSKVLNEEVLNPQGINIIKKVKGNFIIWGDRTIATDPTWKWKHQRELMSHYENRLREGFDFIIFAMNNRSTWALLLTTLRAFFLPEFRKGALDGDSFEEAAQFKIDSENNTDATAAAGDLFSDITLKLANTVERYVIRIGKAGIFEDIQPA